MGTQYIETQIRGEENSRLIDEKRREIDMVAGLLSQIQKVLLVNCWDNIKESIHRNILTWTIKQQSVPLNTAAVQYSILTCQPGEAEINHRHCARDEYFSIFNMYFFNGTIRRT